MKGEIESALASKVVPKAIRQRIQDEYGLQGVVSGLETIYQDAVVETLRREMPVIMYHRFIEQDSEKGVHGTWMPIAMFEKHLRLMKWLGYETLTFPRFGGQRLYPPSAIRQEVSDDHRR